MSMYQVCAWPKAHCVSKAGPELLFLLLLYSKFMLGTEPRTLCINSTNCTIALDCYIFISFLKTTLFQVSLIRAQALGGQSPGSLHHST